MKRHIITAMMIGMALLIISYLHSTNLAAHAGTIVQKQPTSSTATQQSDAIVQQISNINGQIQKVQEQLEQAKREKQLLQQDLQELSKMKPTLPPGSSASDKAQYQKDLNNWETQMNTIKEKIADKDREIIALEAKLKKLKQQL